MNMRLSARSLGSRAHYGLAKTSTFHLRTIATLLPWPALISGQMSSPPIQTRPLCWWGHHRGRRWPHSEPQKRVPRRDRPYVHKCMPHRRREAWREKSSIYNLSGQSWGGRLGSWSWKDHGKGGASKQEGYWLDDSHRSLWKEFEAEQEHLDREFENFKRRIDADPFGALFGRTLQRLSYHPHAPSFWTSICNSLFGGNQGATESRTIDMNKVTEDSNHSTLSAEKPNDSSAKAAANTETRSEEPKTHSNFTGVTSSPSFKFDPISGRMVSTTRSASTEPNAAGSFESDEGVDIPVKKYKIGQSQPGPQIPETSVGEIRGSESLDTGSPGGIGRPEDIQVTSQQSQISSIDSSAEVYQRNEISQEATQDVQSVNANFDTQKPPIGPTGTHTSPKKTFNPSQSEKPIWKFWMQQPSLNSLLRQGESEQNDTPAEKKFPRRERFEDPRDEDLDILSASDIRASYGSMRAKPGIEEDRLKHREELEKDFESYSKAEHDINIQGLRSRARGDHAAGNAVLRPGPETERERIERENIDNLADELQSIYEDSYGKINGSQSQGFGGRSSPAEEKSRASPDAKEIDSLKADAHPPTRMQEPTKLDHQGAMRIASGRLNHITPVSRKVVDKLLEDIREFRKSSSSLLDEIAQTIDQVSSSVQAGSPGRTTRYKILAYDPSSSQVVNAEVRSSAYSPDETPVSPDVFLDVENITKFLPYISELDSEGYEVISATDGVLIFKQMRTVNSTDSSSPAPVSSTGQAKQGGTARVDQVEHNPTIPHPDPFSSSSPSPSTRVHRQETVFTGGPPNWSPYPPPPPIEPNFSTDNTSSSTGDGDKGESFLHKTSRRVLLTGVATAGTCYALGVVSEYFRTGGEDGKGPDGFTAI